MAKSLKQVMAQIDKLQKEASALRTKEISGVVARIREAIDHYALTPADIFGDGTAPRRRGRKPGAKTAATKSAGRATVARGRKSAGVPKYHNGEGKTWTGMGKRPNWFKDALEAGKTAEDLLIK
ncbi:H-NS family nucleoid-associated regulatory protein [Roseateles noduli]|uniref:H-NS histone family protein n=1 Tax=Roseateles noduli TaxID=2052484 RepID=UPI003D64998B